MSKTEKPSLLVIDDNGEVVEFLVNDLCDTYEVITSYNASEALAKMRKCPVNLIISDIMMPGIDGLELCSQLKSDFEYSHIPIILLTAKNSIQSKIEGLNSGADAYIEKPFSPQHLKAQIVSLLNNRNKLKEYFAKSPSVDIQSIAHSKLDEDFLEVLQKHIEENIENTLLDVDLLANLMNVSRPTLYRKIKSISNLSPNEMINISRLKKAVELLSKGQAKIYEIADKVGYNSLTQLGRNFHKQFNMSPTEYAKKLLQQ